jgi:hypothetical protein
MPKEKRNPCRHDGSQHIAGNQEQSPFSQRRAIALTTSYTLVRFEIGNVHCAGDARIESWP